jgi:hypothetical protein
MIYTKEWKKMRITIDVHMIVNGTKSLKRGEFNARKNENIAQFAYGWIKHIRMETGYFGQQSLIEKVIVNGDQDITDQVKEIDAAPIPDADLPF